jgi:DAACS family dicarboxylate/amino acid:cation (Na+ or H+) symporter
MTVSPSRGMSLHTKILLGLVLGAVCGLAVNLFGPRLEGALEGAAGRPVPVTAWVLTYVMDPVGQIFLRLLLMTVVPLVFASLAVGVARLGDLRRLGRVGAKTFAFFVASMSLAVVIGLTLVNTVRPGADLPAETRQHLLQTYGGQAREKTAAPTGFGVQTFVNIVPRNPIRAAADMDMLGIIFFALLVGVGVTTLSPHRSELMVQILDGIGDVMVFIITLAMKLAPFGVFALIFAVTSRFGIDLLRQLAVYVLVVLAGLAIQMFGTLSVLVRLLAGISPLTFFSRVRNVIITAFSTSSSNATLPTSLKTAEEELGIPPQLAGFVLPLGATMNMNGTALFEGVTAVFLAQVFGVPLGLGEQAIVVVLSVLTAIGAAGVPGGSIPLLAMVLTSVGVPAEGIAIIIGVDRLLDMCRTTLNVVGDLAAAAFVTRSEGFPLLAPKAEEAAPRGPGDV